MNLLNKMRQTKWKITMSEFKQNKRQRYMGPCVLYNKPMFKDKKKFGPPLGRPIFKAPVRGVFCTKKIYGDHFLVKHNPDNHFQGANAKTHLGTPELILCLCQPFKF